MDAIAEFERAAEARFQEGMLLMQHGLRGAAAYMFGYCAELVVKAAAFRFLGHGPNDEITKANRDQVWNDAVNIMGTKFRKEGHDAPGWAKWLAEARKRVAAAYDPAWEADLLRHAGTAHALWLPDMRKSSGPRIAGAGARRARRKIGSSSPRDWIGPTLGSNCCCRSASAPTSTITQIGSTPRPVRLCLPRAPSRSAEKRSCGSIQSTPPGRWCVGSGAAPPIKTGGWTDRRPHLERTVRQSRENMELDILKGTRDYLPETQILRQKIADTIKDTFELFGYGPAETPILNHFDVLSSKYAGGAEILKETYRLSDQGGRDLGLRYDLTVPFARMVGMYQGGRLPAVFKRYEIGRVFRNGPVKTGRMREFTQCDADVVTPAGIDTAAVDAEFVAIAERVFRKLGIPAFCCYNNRKFLAGLLMECGVPADKVSDAVLSVDKLAKVGVDGVAEDLKGRGLKPEIAQAFVTRAQQWESDKAGNNALAPSDDAIPDFNVGIAELDGFETALKTLGVPESFLNWEPGLARGLEIYTGTVFEFFWRSDDGSLRPNEKMSSSLGAGGRYDKIIGQFLHPEEPARHAEHPAAGMSFGLDVLTKVLELMHGEGGARRTVTEVLIFPFPEKDPAAAEKNLAFAMRAAAELRDCGVRTEVDYAHKRIKNSVEFADKMNIPFHAAVGGNEAGKGVLALKNLAGGEKMDLPPLEAASRILAARKR